MRRSNIQFAVLALAVPAVLVVAAVLLLWPDTTATAGPGPGMSFGVTGDAVCQGGANPTACTAALGETFTITVSADPAPMASVSGFQTDVLLAGLTWQQRPACSDEPQVTTGGQPPELCARSSGAVGQARHLAMSAYGPYPLPALDEPLGALVEVDVTCGVAGEHEVLLVSTGSYKASYLGLSGTEYPLPAAGTRQVDATGDTVADSVDFADSLLVDCDPDFGTTPTPTATVPPEPAMSLGAAGTASCDAEFDACTVGVNLPFQITVNADPPPGEPVSSFQSEVVLGGMAWQQRPLCLDEVLVTHSGGQPPAVCAHIQGQGGQARHAVATVLTPPIAAFDTPLAGLLEIDVRCPAAGSYEVVLTAGGTFGATYYGADTQTIPVPVVGTRQLDLNGDTTLETVDVADALSITCDPGAGEGPTPTPTATAAATPTPPGPAGMTLGLAGAALCQTETECSVGIDLPFVVTVNAGPVPDFGVAGYQAEVMMGGMAWQQRPQCVAEALVTVGGAPPAICGRAYGPAGQSRHAVLSAGAPMDQPLDTLLELDVTCADEGQHELLLVASGSFNTEYYAANFALHDVPTTGTRQVDWNGDTTPETIEIAGSIMVNCDAGFGDLDDDGCTDIQEMGANPLLGGGRNPNDFWDFFDTPNALGVRDRVVSGLDFFAVLSRYNATRVPPLTEVQALVQALTMPPAAPAYHAAFDRTSAGAFSGPPDSAISGVDFFGVLTQFNADCRT